MRDALVVAVVAALALPACMVARVESDPPEVQPGVVVIGGTDGPDTQPPPVAVATLEPAAPGEVATLDVDLSDTYGCGAGVHAGTAGQHVALHVNYLAGDPEPAGGPSDATLPDPAWDVNVRIGRDLFANWCDDVIEPGEPEPQVNQEWPAVSGSLRILDQPGEGCPAVATIAVVDLVVQRPDGRLVAVPDLTITNDAWGCFAG